MTNRFKPMRPEADDPVAAPANSPDQVHADAATFEALRAAGFEGAAWREYAQHLFHYGLAVLGKWVDERSIVRRALDSGFRVSLTAQRVHLRAGDRDDLLHDALASAIAAHRAQLAKGSWDPTAGAGLKTYFVGQLLIQALVALEGLARDRDKLVPLDALSSYSRGDAHAVANVEQTALARLEVEQALRRLNPRSRQVVVLAALGYDYATIASRTGLSIKAVEGRLARARKLLVSARWSDRLGA